jgi:hypothetical protein
MWKCLLLRISSSTSLQLVLVFGSGVRLVFGLGVLAVQGGGASILLEELGGGLISANLHYTQLIPLPLYQVSSAPIRRSLQKIRRHVRSRLVERTKEM